MYKIEDFLITIYYLIEDDWYPHFCQTYGHPRRAGFSPGLSDSECLTIELVGHYLGYSTQKQLYEQMHDRWALWFPAFNDRVAFVRQCANVWHVKAWIHHHIVQLLAGHQARLQVIDTVLVPICKVARRFQRHSLLTHNNYVILKLCQIGRLPSIRRAISTRSLRNL